jgi:hypothetical protein
MLPPVSSTPFAKDWQPSSSAAFLAHLTCDKC